MHHHHIHGSLIYIVLYIYMYTYITFVVNGERASSSSTASVIAFITPFLSCDRLRARDHNCAAPRRVLQHTIVTINNLTTRRPNTKPPLQFYTIEMFASSARRARLLGWNYRYRYRYRHGKVIHIQPKRKCLDRESTDYRK